MAGERVEHGFLAVQFDAVDRARLGRGDDLGDRGARVVGQARRRRHPDALLVPLDDVMDVGKCDAGVFQQHPLGRDAEPAGARLDIRGHRQGGIAPAGQRHRLARFVQCAHLISDRSGFVNIKMRL
jgi:hypothetical protein